MSTEKTNVDIDLRGLDESQVSASRRLHGENTLTPPPKTSLWKLYLEKYKDPIIRILLVAAVVSLALAFVEHDFIETLGIFLAIFFATTVGFYFERDAAKKFGVLTALVDEQPVKVRRSGRVMEIPRKDVVVGDLVLVEVGDEIPADAELIESTDLQVDESSLTGEPMAAKHADRSKEENKTTYPVHLILRSTMVMGGQGVAVARAVGDETEIGKVARKSTEMTDVKTPLNLQLDKLAGLISKIGTAVSVLAFVVFLGHDVLTNHAVWQGTDYVLMAEVVLKYFMMAVTLIVMAVPEGLPMAVTLSLALNMRRMLRSNNLVRKLHACETMGAVTVICTDKTGTLTQNRMTVVDFVVLDGDKALMAEAIALNTTAELNGDEGIGNPTEVALLRRLQQEGYDYARLRAGAPIEHRVPFSTERKYMTTTVAGRDYMKGAPEIVMQHCDLTDAQRADVTAQLTAWQQKSMRTLAFACGRRLQAIVAISDPVRADVPQSVARCREAGIEVKIVTGDTAATAAEIGRQIGICDAETPEEAFITGPEWAALTDEQAVERAAVLRVMSRARPTDKQRLVQMLQQRGDVVAVTGDGTNDAPALNYAHVGLSLGSGTGVAKEASDMTLLDDSFASIANAVMWGRSLYNNIRRFLFFQLVVNLAALLLVLGGSVVGTEMPLTVTQILWMNLIMDTFAAMALASLPPSREVMADKPRRRTDFIISKSMAQGIFFCGFVFFAVMLAFLVYCERNGGAGIDLRELTMFFTTFVMLQFWNLFNAKCLGSHHSAFRRIWADRGLGIVLLCILGGQWLIVTFGGKMFRTVPLAATDWLVIISATSVVLWAGELWRWMGRLRNK